MSTDFRKHIKEKLKQQHITIYKLAKRAGLPSRISLYKYLNGDSEMTTRNLNKVLEALEDQPIILE